MKHVMVDLETLGKRAGCVVISIGAVAFDPETDILGPEFYTVINRESCLQVGLQEDQETLNWWSQQQHAARIIVDQATEGGILLSEALDNFTEYLSQFGLSTVHLWGNGSDFDNTILSACYSATDKQIPWLFWNNRCYRTLKNLRPELRAVRNGVHHNALDDAKFQAAHAIKLLRTLQHGR